MTVPRAFIHSVHRILLSKAVTPAKNIIKIFNFFGILEINTIGAVISNTTWGSKLLSGLENKLKSGINKHPGGTGQ